ncbi:MAG: phosphoglucomutase/phosphomannomutase family protein [Natronomonas sp.]
MDVEFGTDGWRTTVDEFTVPRIRGVGQAVATYLTSIDETAPVAVGYDPRPTSRDAVEELSRVLCVNGFDVVLAERDTPTPIVAWTVKREGLAGALQVTASHNPPSYNGIKFVPRGGAPAMPAVTDRVATNLAEPQPGPESTWGRVHERDLVEAYLEHALEFVDADLGGLRVAYDAMHGSGREVTDELLLRAGATIDRLRCKSDPEFGGTPPEPTGERLEALADTVAEGDSSLGIANDGDADRIAVVTPERGFVDPNLLYVLLYDYLLESAEGDAVRTVSTTFLVDRIAEAHGRTAHETPVGFKYVAEAMADHDALFGGEESGGYGVTSHLRNKDGVLLALLVAAAHGDEPIDERLDRIRGTYGEIHQDRRSVDCPDDRKSAVLDALDGSIPAMVAGVEVESVGTIDGFKLQLADGSWVLVRPSGTEPKLRVYAEAEREDRVAALLDSGVALLEPLV